MRISRTLLAAVAATVVFAGVAQAQATGKVKWVGVGTHPATSKYSTLANGGGTQWNVYTSPYQAKFQINSGWSPSTAWMPAHSSPPNWNGPADDIFCVDFKHAANTSTAGYSANFTNLGTNAADINTKTRSGNSLQKYKQAAWLASKIAGAAVDSVGDINGAIWQVMSGEPMYRKNTHNVWTASGINSWISKSLLNFGNVNAREWVVVTDQAAAGQAVGSSTSRGSQEYITHVTPEPATLLLLGTGLLATLMAAGALRRSAA